MNDIISQLIKESKPKTVEEAKAILREIVQEVTLIGLSRGGFFKKASFYGGTALRILYGLNRYSEDLDFTLNSLDTSFDFLSYFPIIKEVAMSYGLNIDITFKEKRLATPIKSAFVKLNTYEAFLYFKVDNIFTNLLHKDEVIKIKFEIDTQPCLGFNSEVKLLYRPEYCSLVALDLPSLFAGKLHAVLCRSYKRHVKGRDYYDYLFYLSRKVSPNLLYLKNKLVASGVIKESDNFDINVLKTMLLNRFETVDFKQVIDDVQHFVFKNEDLSYLNKEFFINSVSEIK